MKQAHGTREHFNLYYLFAEDQAAHPMPVERAELLRKLVQDTFVKIHPAAEVDPP